MKDRQTQTQTQTRRVSGSAGAGAGVGGLPHSPFFDFKPKYERSDLKNCFLVSSMGKARSALTSTPKVTAPIFNESIVKTRGPPGGVVDPAFKVLLSGEVRPGGSRLRAESVGARARRQYMAKRNQDEKISAANLFRKPGGKIKECSLRSRMRLAAYTADLDALGVKSDLMVTLTYPGRWREVAPSGKAVKLHLSLYRKRLVRYFKALGLTTACLWFFEFQARGAPHIHLILWGPGVFDIDMIAFRRWSKHAWGEIVSHPDPKEAAKHFRRGCDVGQMVSRHFGYAAKYAAKMKQKAVPDSFQDCGRFWGFFGFKFPKPVVFQIPVNSRQLNTIIHRLAVLVCSSSVSYANKMLNAFSTSRPGSFQNMSASAVPFGADVSRSLKAAVVNHPALRDIDWSICRL